MKKQYLITTNVVHCKKEPYDEYIGRGSRLGNPFTHIKDRKTLAQYVVDSRESSILNFEVYLRTLLENQRLSGSSELKDHLLSLRGKTLGCFCKPKSCHGDVIAKIIEELYYE